MSIYDLTVKKELFRREDGSYYLFSQEQYEYHLNRAYDVISSYNGLSKALSQFEDIADKAKKKDYLLGIISKGGEYVKEEYRKTLEKELKGISFFRAKRAALIEESVDAIPDEIFETINKWRNIASRDNDSLGKPIRPEDLIFTLADDKSCLWVGLVKKYEEDLKSSLMEEVSDEKIKASEKLIDGLNILRELASEGAVLTGIYAPSGQFVPGIVESYIGLNMQGELKPLSLGEIVTRLYIKPKK
mgnify:CR=1 FL=1